MTGLRTRAVGLFLILVIPLAGGGPWRARPASSVIPHVPIGSASEPARAGPDTLWQIQTVDSAGDVGWDTSIAVDTAGRPHVSYCEYGPYVGGTACQELKYTWFDGTSWNATVVDDAWYVGTANALALDSQDRPHIAYGQYNCYMGCGSVALKYAHYNGTSWQIEMVDSGSVGDYTSLALDSHDRPHISYHAYNSGGLKYAWHDGTSWHNEVVDGPGGNKGTYTSIALDAADHPHITYRDELAYQLKYAWYDGVSWQIEPVDTYGLGGWNSLVLDAAGRPHVSYYKRSSLEFVYAWRDGAGWHTKVLETGLGNIVYSSIALDALGRPRITYYAGAYDYDLRYAWYDGAAWRLETVDSGGDVGQYASLALDALDQAHIAYADDTNTDLKYALAPCVALAGLAIAGPPTLPTGITGLYTATYTPTDTTFPELAWDNGAAGPTAAYSWTVPGTYTVVATATNPCSQALDTYTVTAFCQPATGVVVQGARSPYAAVDSAYQVSPLPITASRPLTFTWDNGTVGPTTVYSWTLPGTYTQTVTATNPCGSRVGPFTVTVRCLPVQEAAYTWTPLTPTVAQTVVLTGSANGIGIRWITTTLDPGPTPHVYPSLALDPVGRPQISYYHPDYHELRYTRFDGAAWHTATVETDVDFGLNSATSLALDAAGRPHVSYEDQPWGGLKYAHYDGTAWHTETVQGGWGTGGGNSLALDSAGYPHISYDDNGWLRYAWHDGASWHSAQITEWYEYPRSTSLALDGAGRPHIAYYASSYHWLMYTWYDGSAWHPQYVRGQDSYPNVSMVLDANGNPHITCIRYDLDGIEPAELLYLWSDGAAWYSETVEVAWRFGWYTSLELDSLGRPHIGYSRQECDPVPFCTLSEVRHAFYDGAAWQIEAADGAGDRTVLALDALDRPHMAYGRQGLHYARLEPGPLTPPISYTWALGDGHVLQGEVVEHVYTQPGPYTVVLTASNCQGEGLAVATHTLMVAPCEAVHDVAFSWTPLTPTVNQWTAFHARAAGGAPIVYRWAFGDGGQGGGANISHRYTAPGVYPVLLTATNCVSAAVTVAHTLTVAPPPCEPVHDATFAWAPFTPTAGLPVTFSAAASGTAPFTFTWDLGDGPAGAGVTVTHIYTAAGSYTVTLTAANCATTTAVVTHAVGISCAPPRDVGLVWTPLTPTVGAVVAFTATAAGTEPLAFTWAFGDGGTAAGITTTHAFAAAGAQVITVTVVNGCAGATEVRALWVRSTVWRIYLPLVVLRWGAVQR